MVKTCHAMALEKTNRQCWDINGMMNISRSSVNQGAEGTIDRVGGILMLKSLQGNFFILLWSFDR